MSRISRAPAAKRDAVSIWRYVSVDDPAAADRLIERIDAKLRTLAEQPRIGTPRDELGPGLRSVAVGNYTLYYQPIAGGIRLVRILHAARDVSRAFR